MIASLAAGKKMVPFRESLLTTVLAPSLRGAANTSIIFALSPSQYNVHETCSSLRFAQRCCIISKNSKEKTDSNSNKTEAKETTVVTTKTTTTAEYASNTEFEGSINVMARIRPILRFEYQRAENMNSEQGRDHIAPLQIDGTWFSEFSDKPASERIGSEIICHDEERTAKFQVSKIFADVTQSTLFEVSTKELIRKSVENGENAAILAYGQTGSGKTFTIFGATPVEASNKDLFGLMPRSSVYLFELLEMNEKAGKIVNYEVNVAFMEIYIHNSLRDLLHLNTKNNKKRGPLKIREPPKQGGVFVENLEFEKVENCEQVLKWLAVGNSNRTIAATMMNAASSRGHTIFTMKCKVEHSNGKKFESTLQFLDLAGSERVKKSAAAGRVSFVFKLAF